MENSECRTQNKRRPLDIYCDLSFNERSLADSGILVLASEFFILNSGFFSIQAIQMARIQLRRVFPIT